MRREGRPTTKTNIGWSTRTAASAGSWRGGVRWAAPESAVASSARTRTSRPASGRRSALREVEGRHQAMLRAVPDLMFVLDKDGVYLDFHAPDPALLLFPPIDFIGRNVREVFPPDLADRIGRCLEETMESGEARTLEYDAPHRRQGPPLGGARRPLRHGQGAEHRPRRDRAEGSGERGARAPRGAGPRGTGDVAGSAHGVAGARDQPAPGLHHGQRPGRPAHDRRSGARPGRAAGDARPTS